MQSQPRPDDLRSIHAKRERQAAHVDDDTFKGGISPRRIVGMKAPWMIGSGRLFNNRRPRVSEEQEE